MSEALTLARRYIDLERPDSALEALEHVREEELEDTEYWVIRTRALFLLERADASAEAAQKGLELDPEDWGMLDQLGLAFAALVERAVDRVIDEALDTGGEPPLRQEHLVAARAEMRPSTLEWLATARNYVEFANQGGLYEGPPFPRLAGGAVLEGLKTTASG